MQKTAPSGLGLLSKGFSSGSDASAQRDGGVLNPTYSQGDGGKVAKEASATGSAGTPLGPASSSEALLRDSSAAAAADGLGRNGSDALPSLAMTLSGSSEEDRARDLKWGLQRQLDTLREGFNRGSVAQWEVSEQLGKGGFGTVYKVGATHSVLITQHCDDVNARTVC